MRVFMVVANDSNVDAVRGELTKLQRAGATLIEVPDASAAKVVGAVAEALVHKRDELVAVEPERKSSPPKRTKSGTQRRVVNGVASRTYHAWVNEGPALDRCAKCGMLREHLEKGVLAFMDRNGRVVERPPFGDPTPNCDALLVTKRLVQRAAT